jgi:hypothetical protein
MKLNYIFRMLAFLVFGICLSNCKCPYCENVPAPLSLRLTSKIDSSDLISNGTYSIDSISFYYNEENVIRRINPDIVFDSANNRFIITSFEVSWKSSEGFKDYFIRLSSKDTDTIYLSIGMMSDRCCSSYYYKSFKYNGIEQKYDPREYGYVIFK